MEKSGRVVACILVTVGIMLFVVGVVLIASEKSQRERAQEIDCRVLSIKWTMCSTSTPGGPLPCGIITIGAEVCGNVTSSSDMLVHASNYGEVQKEYPVGSSVKCWKDDQNCSVDTDDDRPSILGGVMVLLLSIVVLALGFSFAFGCCCFYAPPQNYQTTA